MSQFLPLFKCGSYNTNPESSQSKLKFSIYPDKYLFDQVKTLAKIKDKDVNKMFLDLTQEAILKEEYQTAIQTLKKFF